jgi:thioredoxin-like negative regulator of GroEL
MDQVNIQAEDWETIMNSEVPVVVEFWHHMCAFCKMVEPIYAQLPDKLGERAKITRINILESRKNHLRAVEEGVMGLPTFKVYCSGRSVGDLVGAKTLEDLTQGLENLIDSAEDCIKQSTALDDLKILNTN